MIRVQEHYMYTQHDIPEGI